MAGKIVELGTADCRLEADRSLDVGELIAIRLEQGPHLPAQMGVHAAMPTALRGRVVPECVPNNGAAAKRGPGPLAQATGQAFTIRFEEHDEHARVPRFDRAILVIGVLIFVTVVAAILHLKYYNVKSFWDHPLLNFYSLLVAGYVLSRFFVAAFYRPPCTTGYTPTVTIIIAAKNEEAVIGKTLDCIFQSDYPRNMLDVLAIDDGSTDQTFREMELARARNSGLTVIRFPENRGKRRAMAAGIRQASGEILVFVDSDTFLRPDAIRKLVRGFADPRVGAICGHAFVQNARENRLTRMQEVYYYVSFRILKAAESVFGTVTCCSGCLGAYRRTAVLEILDHWLNQRFLGAPAIGDDRSLTNHILRNHRVLYDSEAICTTIAPANLRQYFRQQLRWQKSWILESIIASGYFWKRHLLAAIFFYAGVVLSLAAPLCVLRIALLPFFGLGMSSVIYLYGALLMALLYSLFYLIRFRDRLWIYGVLFQFFYAVTLTWQLYYALITVRRNHWGTR